MLTPRDNGSDLRTRSMVGAALMIVALAILRIGGVALWALASLLALGMLIEWAGLAKAGPARRALAVAALALGLALACPAWWGTDRATVAAIVALALAVGIVCGDGKLGFGLCYAGLPAVALLFLREQPHGTTLPLWTLAIVWATDIGAYFVGRAVGGPLLAPRLSPKKTWAGLGGGVAAAAIAGATLALLGGLPGAFVWLGAPLAILAQAGDLYESALKRRAQVKDSGRLLPGHGGLLDRLDGLVPVATLVATLVAGGALAA